MAVTKSTAPERVRRPEADPPDDESAVRLRTAFDHMAVGIVMVDLEGRWIEVNDAACRITGHRREGLIGRRVVDITHPEDRAKSRELMQRLLDGDWRECCTEKRYVGERGQIIWARITVALARDASGRPMNFVGALQDISAQKRLDAQQAGLRDALELMAHGAELPAILAALVRFVESCSVGGARGSILLLDPDRRHLRQGAAPSLPDAFSRVLDGLAIGPAAACCGAAAALNARVEAEDIAQDERWKPLRAIALEHGLRACSSQPICSSQGHVLGTFAIYYDSPRPAAAEDLELVELAVRTAAIAIERARAEEVLRASEAKFAAAFGQSPLGLTITSLETGKIIEVNQGLLDVTGYAREDLIGRSPDQIGLWIEPEQRRERFEMLTQGRRPPDIEARFRIRDGSEKIALVASTLIEVDGRPCVLTSVVDITERKRAEQALRESEERFRHMADNAPVMVWVTEPDGHCSYLSKSWYAFTGQSPETGLGFGWLDAVHPDDRQPAHEAFLSANARSGAFQVEYRLRRHDGEYRWAIDAATPRRDDGGRHLGYIGSVIDITERKRAEQDLRQSEALQRFLVELNTVTQSLTDPDRIMAVTAELLGRHLDADRCAYAEVEADENTVVITGDYIRNVPSMVGRTQLAYFGETTWRMLRDGQTYVTDDVDTDPRSPPDLFVYRATMIRAAIAVPLRKDGRLVAGMAVTHASPRRWRAEEVQLVELVVNRCWEAIERARVLRRLGESEARARLALDVAGQGTWSWDGETDSVEADARCRDICGLPPGPLTFDQARARIHRLDVARVEAAIARALAPDSDGAYAEEFRVVHPDGAERWVQSRGQVQWRGGRRRTRVLIGTVLDITERKRTEEELTSNDRRKDEFLAVLAHELRNPLAPLRNVLHIMRLSSGPEPLVEMMERQVDHMVRLVDDLLEVSRISRGKIDLKREPLELGVVLRQVVESAAPLMEKAGHRLDVDLADDALKVEADPVRLAQVFSNLLNNAAKFTPAGGRIGLSARREGRDVVVSVRDTGIGIPREMLGRVFEMFTQVDRSTHRAEGGLGIGLSLARNLVELHGGRIEARSEGPGRGSEFVVRLPASDHTVGAERPRSQSLVPVQPRRVLVVDDNRDAANSLGMLLNFLGADVAVAHSGPAALDMLETHRPSLVLLDLGMPEMDGYEVARRVRERHGSSIRIVALSGWGYDEDRRRTADAGFDQHLIKPADATALQAMLSSLESRPG